MVEPNDPRLRPPIQDGDGELHTPRKSRQGPLGRPVLIVLLVSLMLAAIAMASTITWGVFTPAP